MSRSQIDRLTRRIEALQAQRKPPEQRIFTVLVRNHMRTDEEIARFCAEHGVTDSDLLIAQVLVPFETRPGETAKDAYERELRAMAAWAQRPRGAAGYCLAATQKIPLVAFLGQNGTKHVKLPRAGGSGLGADRPLRPYGSAHFGPGLAMDR